MRANSVPTILPPIISADYGCDAAIRRVGWPVFTGSIFTIPSVTSINPPMGFYILRDPFLYAVHHARSLPC